MANALILVAMLLSFASAAQFAVLIAGSNGFWNYRH
jgi:glycosylphosphatidylinositol transamidase (GPIT) subunit GPI8